jgi:hypothetical protein
VVDATICRMDVISKPPPRLLPRTVTLIAPVFAMLANTSELDPPLVRSVVNANVTDDCCCPTLTKIPRKAVTRLLDLRDVAESLIHSVESTAVRPNPIRTVESKPCAMLDPSTVTLSAAVAGPFDLVGLLPTAAT